jgi:hypothetical protein
LDFLNLQQAQRMSEDSDTSTTPDGDLILESGSVMYVIFSHILQQSVLMNHSHVASPECKSLSPVRDIDELSVSLGKIGFAVDFRCDSAGKSSCSSGSNISTPTSSLISTNFDPTAPTFIPRGTSSNGTTPQAQFNPHQRRQAQKEKGFKAYRSLENKPKPTPGIFRSRPPYSHTLCKKSTRGSCTYGANCRFGHDGDRYVDSPHVTQRFFGTRHAEQWWEPDGKGGEVVAFGSMEDGIRRRRALDIVTPPLLWSKGARRNYSGRDANRRGKADSNKSLFGVNNQLNTGVGDTFSSHTGYLKNPGPATQFSHAPGHQFAPPYGQHYIPGLVGPFGPGFAPQFAPPPHPDNQHPGPFVPGYVNPLAPDVQPMHFYPPVVPPHLMHPGPFMEMFPAQAMYAQFGQYQEFPPPFDKHIHRQPGMAMAGR